jgi:hypothetical protein
VARRSKQALEQIGEKVPLDQLKFPTSDVIQTAEFPISGRIVTPTMKAFSPYFGEVQLQIADLRLMRSLVGSGDLLVNVDAARYGSAQDQWMETDYHVSGSTGLVITATGQVDLWPQGPGQYMTGPAGYGAKRGQYQSGILLGRVGENGKVFIIGDRFEGTVPEEGKLYLHIVPSPWNNASTGGYAVKITSKH